LAASVRISVRKQGEGDIDGSMRVTSDAQTRFDMLYTEHRLEVLAYCTRRVGTGEAADACSETFLVAWRRIHEVPPPPRTLPYLYGVAARVVSNQRRALHRRSRLQQRLRALRATPPRDLTVPQAQDEQGNDVLAALCRLKPKDREILLLCAWEDLPRETVAEMMGMTRAAIDQRIHRSRQRLAPMLEPVELPPVSPPIAETGGA
jgi:RNA polymerase sigma factor (sigma-70 family)